jgi:hypothetical protein
MVSGPDRRAKRAVRCRGRIGQGFAGTFSLNPLCFSVRRGLEVRPFELQPAKTSGELVASSSSGIGVMPCSRRASACRSPGPIPEGAPVGLAVAADELPGLHLFAKGSGVTSHLRRRARLRIFSPRALRARLAKAQKTRPRGADPSLGNPWNLGSRTFQVPHPSLQAAENRPESCLTRGVPWHPPAPHRRRYLLPWFLGGL